MFVMSKVFNNIVLSENQFKFKFTTSHVIYRDNNSNYCVAVSTVFLPENTTSHLDDEVDSIIVTGMFQNLCDGDSFEAIGQWNNTSRGWQINVDMSVSIIPENINGLKNFIVKYCKGVGISTASKLISAYGLSTIDKIKENIANITSIGISNKKAEAIRSSILSHDEIEEITLFLLQHGLTNYKQIISIYDELKPNAINKIKDNPYCICDKLGLSSFAIADKISISQNFVSDELRLSNAIYYFISHFCKSSGHVFIFKSYIDSHINSFINSNGIIKSNYSQDQIDHAIQLLIDCDKIATENDGVEECVYLKFYELTENKCVNIIKDFIKSPDSHCYSSDKPIQFINKFQKENNTLLADMQKQAIQYANSNRFIIITGGPGTGKTHTLNAIIKYFQSCDKNLDISLAAPTGRAAKRMTELTNMPASTVHRLLGLYDEDADNDEELDTDILIIDEFSMVDIFLFSKILVALQNTDTKLIIVGDYNQLPSVGPGLVLRDLICSKVIPTIILTEIFRQAQNSQIVQNAHKILKNITTTSPNCLTFDPTKGDFYFIHQNSDKGILEKIVASVLYLSKKTFNIDDIIVMSPMRKGFLGINNLNKVLQELINPKSPTKQEISVYDDIFRVGDKVMQMVNNYQLEWTEKNELGLVEDHGMGVFNGESGKIVNIYTNEEDSYIDVDFDGNFVTYDSSNFSNLALAYAITVHKAQGSEYPCVLMPVSDNLVNTDKNILYTAVTRAKSMFTFIGSERSLNSAINKNLSITRNSRLQEKLAITCS